MSNNIIFDRPNYSNSDSLILALFVAIIVHIIVGMTVKFTTPQVEKINRYSIDVTLTQTPAKKPPKKAKFLASENQEGAGDKVKKAEPPTQKLPSHAEKHDASHEKPIKKIQSEDKEAQKIKHQAAPKAIVKKKSEKKMVVADKPVITHKVEERPHIDLETLQQQTAEKGAEFSYNQRGGDDKKTKRADQVSSAHKFVASQYLSDWNSKVEHMGNLNVPDIPFKGAHSLTMDVGINPNGSVHHIHIRIPSGNAALDKWAIKIVKMNAPFAHLPRALLKEVDVLVMSRKWNFQDESDMTAQ
ncbi:TonB family protein [Crenothrix polyspora]|uniref:TonB family protein n=1 Tax=Crenothrix polyspora TaxID=360316 RepID=A0A1R4HIM4_9GAMM|nr:TonB C-terminal domain-containing protein [Crenothrix polyspora]SJM96063.1 TonB family protein [Crenothrix polyspora]